jgi:hypothetical protein
MGRLIQKSLLDWDQPRRVRRLLAAQEGKRSPWWVRPASVAAIAAPFLALWLVSGRKISFSLAISVAVSIALFLVYAVPFLSGLVPSVVKVMEKELRVSEGGSVVQWPYESIAHCAILPVACEGETASVLAVTLKEGDRAVLAVAPEVSLEELQRILAERGVALDSSALGNGS